MADAPRDHLVSLLPLLTYPQFFCRSVFGCFGLFFALLTLGLFPWSCSARFKPTPPGCPAGSGFRGCVGLAPRFFFGACPVFFSLVGRLLPPPLKIWRRGLDSLI